jgi:hypothetical protein
MICLMMQHFRLALNGRSVNKDLETICKEVVVAGTWRRLGILLAEMDSNLVRATGCCVRAFSWLSSVLPSKSLDLTCYIITIPFPVISD